MLEGPDGEALLRRTHAKSLAAPFLDSAGGRVSIQTLRGEIGVEAQGRTFRLPQGGLLTLDQGIPHDVEALEDSAFLLTVAWAAREHLPPSP
jgi:hypothetical protein